MTPYSDVFRSFKNKIEDPQLAMLSDEDQTEQQIMWMDSGISYIELDGLKIINDLSDRDDDSEQFNTELSKMEIELISLYMVIAWYDIKINSIEHMLPYFGSKDEKWTSQKDHMTSMQNAQKMYHKKAKGYFLDYVAKNNKYLEG